MWAASGALLGPAASLSAILADASAGPAGATLKEEGTMPLRIFGRWTAVVVLLAAAVTMSAQTCPATVKGSKIPSNNWKASSTKAGYYALDSAIINAVNTEDVVVGSAPYATVKSYMGSAFGDANFTLLGSPGTSSQLGPNVYQCTYDGPRFHHSGKTMVATVVVNCTKGAACNF